MTDGKERRASSGLVTKTGAKDAGGPRPTWVTRTPDATRTDDWDVPWEFTSASGMAHGSFSFMEMAAGRDRKPGSTQQELRAERVRSTGGVRESCGGNSHQGCLFNSAWADEMRLIRSVWNIYFVEIWKMLCQKLKEPGSISPLRKIMGDTRRIWNVTYRSHIYAWDLTI